MSTFKENLNPLEYSILNNMKDTFGPMGAGSLVEMLKKQDITISEAGIGRALRTFRHKGLLNRVGFQGHIITQKGIERLEKLQETRELGNKLNDLLNLGPMRGQSVMDILITRRALEREAAYQAALNATTDDIQRLDMIIHKQYQVMENNENYADISTAFHREVINVSRVPLLKNLYELIGLSVQWQDFFIGTFKMYNQPLNVSHEKIFKAIKDRDPDQAAHFMLVHLTDVIDNAKKLDLDKKKPIADQQHTNTFLPVNNKGKCHETIP